MVRQSKEKQTENKRYDTAVVTNVHYSDAFEPAEESASSYSQLPLQSTVNTRPVSPSQPPAKKPKRDRSVEMRTLQAAMKHPFKEINCSCKKNVSKGCPFPQGGKSIASFGSWMLTKGGILYTIASDVHVEMSQL